MGNYISDTAESRREHALDESIRSTIDPEATTEDIVRRAREFEKYLKHGSVQVTIRESPHGDGGIQVRRG